MIVWDAACSWWEPEAIVDVLVVLLKLRVCDTGLCREGTLGSILETLIMVRGPKVADFTIIDSPLGSWLGWTETVDLTGTLVLRQGTPNVPPGLWCVRREEVSSELFGIRFESFNEP